MNCQRTSGWPESRSEPGVAVGDRAGLVEEVAGEREAENAEWRRSFRLIDSG